MTNHRDSKLVTTKKRRNHLVSEPKYNATNFSSKILLATEMKKTPIHMNKSFYLGLPILELSKIVMYELWYDYVKPYWKKQNYFIGIQTVSFLHKNR